MPSEHCANCATVAADGCKIVSVGLFFGSWHDKANHAETRPEATAWGAPGPQLRTDTRSSNTNRLPRKKPSRPGKASMYRWMPPGAAVAHRSVRGSGAGLAGPCACEEPHALPVPGARHCGQHTFYRPAVEQLCCAMLGQTYNPAETVAAVRGSSSKAHRVDRLRDSMLSPPVGKWHSWLRV